MTKRALLSFSRAHFDPTGKEQLFYSASVSIIAKSLYDSLIRAGYEVTYIDASETPKDPASYDLFVGQPLQWTEIAEQCTKAVRILFMVTTHPQHRNACMQKARKEWGVPRAEELFDISSPALRAFQIADHIMQIGNEIDVDALLAHGVPREKIIHIHYGLPLSWRGDAPLAHGALDTYIHTASELGLRKGLPVILKLFSAPPFSTKHLTLMGEIRKNENHAYWQSRMEELDANNPLVTHVGFMNSSLDKYKEVLADHAWYLFPSVEEGEPGTVLDAMTLGLVPVLTRESGIDFALDDDFDASFETSIAKTLSLSQAEWETLSVKARRYVTLFHDHELWEARLTELFSALYATQKDLRPTASIILTVHDKEKHIVRLLGTLVSHTSSYPKWDLHIVYDGCTDASREAARETLSKFPVPVYEYETPDVWEVKANNYGLKRAHGKYCIILQDDNFIYEHGWLEKMLSWLEEHPKVGILGGLAGVNFFHLDSDPQGQGANRSIFEVHQRLDPAVDKKLSTYVFEADAVMRGPIILRKELLEKHGYLDEAYAPLYNDDMDYCFRMRSLGYGVFCYPINVVNESLTVAQYGNPEKDTFWRTTSEKNQRLFYARWKDDLEKHHRFQLKVPKPAYQDATAPSREDIVRRIQRSLPTMSISLMRQKMRLSVRAFFVRLPAPLVQVLIKGLRKIGRGALADLLYIHRFEPKTIPWRLAQGDTTLRLAYPLTASSLVYALGQEDPSWKEALHARYGVGVDTIATSEKSVSEISASMEALLKKKGTERIDLVCLRLNGTEYDLIPHLITTGLIQKIANLQIRFSDQVPDARARMHSIRKQLRETHAPTYQYEFVWENWERKED
ncbi:MAG: glycosyltransferase [Minisyncoccia bacterium]